MFPIPKLPTLRAALLPWLLAAAVPSAYANPGPEVPPDPVDVVLDTTTERSYPQRLLEVRNLGAGLQSDEVGRLLDFVSAPRPHGVRGAALRSHHAVNNEVLNVLRRQTPHLDQVRGGLLTLARQPDADPVMRDYALQHLASLTLDGEPAGEYNGFSAHLEALDGDQPALAATAMVHLLAAQRAGRLPADPRDRLAAAARRMASDPDAPPAPRATALQVAARLGLRDLAPLAREIAGDPAGTFPLRIAALSALGELSEGDPDTLDFLRETAGGFERRLQPAAASALSKLEHLPQSP